MIHNCNSETLLLDVCPRATIIQGQKMMCLGMLTLALFEIEKIRDWINGKVKTKELVLHVSTRISTRSKS